MGIRTANAGLGWYLDQIKSTPLLSADEERQLARRVREHSDPFAREQMVNANLRLVVTIAKDYSNPGMTLGDLVAEGNLGLMRAVEEFNPDAGVRFSTYAAWWIKQSIRRAMINAGQPIHIPAYLAKLITKWRKASSELEAELGRPPTVEEMGRRLDITAKKADIIFHGLQAVNAPSQMGMDETQAMCEMVADDITGLPEQALMDASNTPIVDALLDKLDPRSRNILELRFGMGRLGRAAADVQADRQKVGLTRERVRQLEKKALAELHALVDDLI